MRTGIIYHIHATPMLVKNITTSIDTTSLDVSRASHPECVPVLVLKNCKPELSKMLGEPFEKCLGDSCFPECGKVISVVSVFKNGGEISTTKDFQTANYLLSLVEFLKNLEIKGLMIISRKYFFSFLGLLQVVSFNCRSDSCVR